MLVLASASPRRQELLRNARFVFKVVPAEVSEDLLDNEAPDEYTKRLALDKARAIYSKLAGANADPLYVLGADTTVVADEHVLGKPADEHDAARMLRLLSGRTHQVITGVALVGEDFEDVRCEITQVTFAVLSEEEVQDYVATGEPMDKAGAYGIQSMASRWIPRVDGCYFNVVGLPVQLVYRMMRAHGLM